MFVIILTHIYIHVCYKMKNKAMPHNSKIKDQNRRKSKNRNPLYTSFLNRKLSLVSHSKVLVK